MYDNIKRGKDDYGESLCAFCDHNACRSVVYLGHQDTPRLLTDPPLPHLVENAQEEGILLPKHLSKKPSKAKPEWRKKAIQNEIHGTGVPNEIRNETQRGRFKMPTTTKPGEGGVPRLMEYGVTGPMVDARLALISET